MGGAATLARCEPCPSREPRADGSGSTTRRGPVDGLGRHASRGLAADIAAARRVAAAVNATRRAGEPSAQAGELAALELLHEIFHLLVVKAAELVPPSRMDASTDAVEEAVGEPVLAASSTRSATSSPTSTTARRPSGSRSCC